MKIKAAIMGLVIIAFAVSGSALKVMDSTSPRA
jgi:hypothetical protein